MFLPDQATSIQGVLHTHDLTQTAGVMCHPPSTHAIPAHECGGSAFVIGRTGRLKPAVRFACTSVRPRNFGYSSHNSLTQELCCIPGCIVKHRKRSARERRRTSRLASAYGLMSPEKKERAGLTPPLELIFQSVRPGGERPIAYYSQYTRNNNPESAEGWLILERVTVQGGGRNKCRSDPKRGTCYKRQLGLTSSLPDPYKLARGFCILERGVCQFLRLICIAALCMRCVCLNPSGDLQNQVGDGDTYLRGCGNTISAHG